MDENVRRRSQSLHTATHASPWPPSRRRPISKRRQSDSPQQTQNTFLRFVHRHPDPRYCRCRHSFSSLPKKQPRQPREFALPTPNARSRASCISCERIGSSPDGGGSPRGWTPGTPRTPSVAHFYSRSPNKGWRVLRMNGPSAAPRTTFFLAFFVLFLRGEQSSVNRHFRRRAEPSFLE